MVTMQTFHSQGATIYDYSSVATCRQGRFTCWPHTNDMIVEYPYSIVNASYHEDEIKISTSTADAETTTVILSSQGIVDYTTVPTTSHSTATVTQTATANATSTEAVLTTEIAQVIYLFNVTENVIDHTTATTIIGRTKTVANQTIDPTTSTLVLVATALVESVVTRTTTVTGILLPPQQTSEFASSSDTYSQTTAIAPETEHNVDDCTLVEHRHYHRHKHHKGYKNYKNEDGEDEDEDED